MTMDPVGLAILTAVFAVALLGLWIGTRLLKPAPRPGQGGLSRPGAPTPSSRASSSARPGISDDATDTLLMIAASEAATPATSDSPSTCGHIAATDSHSSLDSHGDFGGHSNFGGHSDAGGCGY